MRLDSIGLKPPAIVSNVAKSLKNQENQEENPYKLQTTKPRKHSSSRFSNAAAVRPMHNNFRPTSGKENPQRHYSTLAVSANLT